MCARYFKYKYGSILQKCIVFKMNNSQKIQYKRFNSRAIIPYRATEGSAGYDIFTYQDVSIPPNSTQKIPTGFGMKLPANYYAIIHARSSHSIMHTTIGAGIIDNDYTGEVHVIYTNMSSETLYLKANSKIAQFVIEKMIIMDKVEIVKSFPTTTRCGGFGSTD